MSVEYVAFPLCHIKPHSPLCADIYVKVAGKYIKYRHEHDEITAQKYDDLIAKHLREVYFEKSSLEKVVAWLREMKQKRIDEAVEKIGEENRKIAEKQEEISERIIETFAEEELSTETVDILLEQTEDFISDVKELAPASPALAVLRKKNPTIAEHSQNVANVAVFLALSLGHGHQAVLENIYMGAIFHDYAKAKIPPEVLKNRTGRLYSQAIQDHPIKAKAMLKHIPGLTKPVFDIIAQHEEQWDGKGYPNNLKGEEIYGLAQIVSIANVFDNVCEDNRKKTEKDMYNAAIKAIEYDRGRRFNPELLERAVDALKLGYGNYFRDRESKAQT